MRREYVNWQAEMISLPGFKNNDRETPMNAVVVDTFPQHLERRTPHFFENNNAGFARC